MNSGKQNGYEILHSQKKGITWIIFKCGPQIFNFRLTQKEWNNFITFLQRTKNKRALPKFKIQYSEFDIDTNKYRHADSRPTSYPFFKKLLGEDKGNDEILKDIKARESIRLKDKRADAKRYLVNKNVYLRIKNATIHMARVQFFQLREYCLNKVNIKAV